MRIGVTGHQKLPKDGLLVIRTGIRDELQRAVTRDELVGVTSLAAGADQLFARLVLDVGGSLHIIVPSSNYERTFADKDLKDYRELKHSAERVDVLPFSDPNERAFFEAGKRVVDECDELIAVWDGLPAKGLGGTADVVRYAHSRGRVVVVVWPSGMRR